MEPKKESNPNYLPYPPQPTDDEIDLRELFKALWKGKWIIIATTFIFVIGSVLYALSFPNIYKADALLAPTESSNGGGLSKIGGQLGGLAALAGVNLSGVEMSQAELAVQVMKSRQFVESFINRHGLLVPLMATKSWDMANNKLVVDDNIYNTTSEKWLRDSKGLLGPEPSAQEAYEVFVNDIFNVNMNKDTGLYSISIKHYSPFIAKQWVNWIVEDINQVMRERAISEISKNLTYLSIQLNKTSIADMRNTFYKLIEDQTKSLMLAEAQEEFVFKTIDPAVVPERKFGPNRVLLVILGVLLGIGLSISVLTLRFFYLNK
ncbi:LPS O-antigen length regulator [Vibrio parahaemolyticus]|nr:LPS O-antigen length regulator [Vibrio parahaemolyticus]EIU7055252.1 LPS O-antigen length regulator [Vibrio parahaemolyticus]HCE5202749.1 LPS O-antigen length regulator [Vibrio parahaemolyticus]HCH6176180.1 LPS O-antigen length regulator [Vibrio parahaemolyticus]HCH6569316.1 LPS O-antigen length regulator [Vibrio parahaemolyticus]